MRKRCSQFGRAFTLVELLVVMGIAGIVAGLLLPALSKGKNRVQGASCRNNLKQIGLTLTMYLSSDRRFPPCLDRNTDQTWADRLNPEAPLNWTNHSWQCPAFMADNGLVERVMHTSPRDGVQISISYSYNAFGIVGYGNDMTSTNYNHQLGLGWRPYSASSEPEVLAPSEMFTVADARPVPEAPGSTRLVGFLAMNAYWFAPNETAPLHGQGYNMLFSDGHVAMVKRTDYLFPPRTARNWNRDNQPHAEAWAPRSDWVVKQ
ncbi:MAG: type II secretion system protein [Limisphaerales bacterium]